jgi:heme oxygenase
MCSSGTMHERLRAATRLLHRRVEASIDVQRRFSSKEAYRELLERLLGLHLPLEAALKSLDWPANSIDLVQRQKCSWLECDLRHLGHSSETLARIPAFDRLPLVDIETGLGWLYVVEGSTLGGQLLSKAAHTALGVTRERGARFFASYGSQVGSMWQEFLRSLNLIDPHSSYAQRVERGAHDMFLCFEEWLSRSDYPAKTRRRT